MPYFALLYEVIDDFVARRVPFRADHLRLTGEANGLVKKWTVRTWTVVVGQTSEIASPSGGRLQ